MKTLRLTCLAVAFISFASAAQAQLIVQGKGDAARCYSYAIAGNSGSRTALATCTDAFDVILTRNDKAATHVNRGVLYMRKGDHDRAVQDYEAALAINPDLAEAHVNYAASLIRQEKFDAALSSLEKALLDPESRIRPEALYNRAIIFDRKENYRGAYRDLKEALVIRPDWAPAIALLDRYEIRPAGKRHLSLL